MRNDSGHGPSLLAARVGKPLQAIRVQSYYLDGVLVESYSAVFFRFDHWLKVVSAHAETRVAVVAEPAIRAFDPSGPRSQYPVSDLPPGHVLAHVPGRQLLGAQELVAASDSSRSFGIELQMEGAKLRLLSIDGESMDVCAGRSALPEELRPRPLLRLVDGPRPS